MVVVYVDADGCPVKGEVLHVARRYSLKVVFVANSWMRTPSDPLLDLVIVDGQFDAADDWIVTRVTPNDVVVSGDIPLAARCLERGARVISPSGRIFTEDSIGDALVSRAISAHLRELGTITGGPAAFGKKARSLFLQRLDEVLSTAIRAS